MIPTAFVALDAFPLNPNGKVDRNALPAPEAVHFSEPETFHPPQTPLEEQIATIWQTFLHISHIDRHANFFALGGHSLLAMQIVHQLQKTFPGEFSLTTLFENPTIAQLAQVITHATGTPSTSPISPVPRDQPLPLSFAQQRLWFIAQLDGGSATYNVPMVMHLQGPLNVAYLTQSINEVVNRHEILRTTFTTTDQQPIQVIHPVAPVSMPIIDLRQKTPLAQETDIKNLLAAEANQQFDLTNGPLLQTKLIRRTETDYIWAFTMPHIVIDVWSLHLFIQEVTTIYTALCNSKSPLLPEIRLQYVDFSVWQRKVLAGELGEQQRVYWQTKLAGMPSVIALPTDYPRPVQQTFKGNTYRFMLPLKEGEGLKDLCQKQQISLFTGFLALFKLLLWRYTQNDDIVVGSPFINRSRVEFEPLIGFFLNTLVLRTHYQATMTFLQVLAAVQKTVMEAQQHQDYPFDQLVVDLQPKRDLSYAPLFQVMFIWENITSQEATTPNLIWTPLSAEVKSAKFDLTMYVLETPDGLQGALEYNTDLFARPTIERMAEHFVTLLKSVTTRPNQPISTLNLLPPAEYTQLAQTWNKTEQDYPREMCFHHCFEKQVAQRPHAIAFVWPGGDNLDGQAQTLTYADLNAKANQVSHYLQNQGVSPGTLVGIAVERSPDMLIGLLGILKAGAAYIPLDPAYPADRLAFMLYDAQAKVLLTQTPFVEQLPAGDSLKVICLDGDAAKINHQPVTNPTSKVTPTHLAYIIYTSGSTGKPKGVQIAHQTLLNFLSSMRYKPGFTAQDSLLAVTTLSFDIAGLELYLPLLCGGKIVLSSRQSASDASQLATLLQDYQITVMQATPVTWQLLLTAGWTGQAGLKMLCGGEGLPQTLAAQLQPKGASLWNMYGPTETTIWSAVEQVTPAQVVQETGEGFIPLGQPIGNTELYILDRYCQLAPIGIPGQLHIGGEGLARGYLGRPELTAEKFMPHPFTKTKYNRLYQTGDLVRYLADGSLVFLGRIDHQVKVRGFRIELGDIEAALNQHPAVRQAVVNVWQGGRAETDKRLIAYFIPQKETIPTATILRDFLSAKLPAYMVPATFIPLTEFPLTPNKKVNRKALPPPEANQLGLNKAYVPPETKTEETLCAIWATVLKVNQVGRMDNFFELGGHSLLATQIISRLQNKFQVTVTLRHIFENPLVADLGRMIDTLIATQTKPGNLDPIPPLARSSEEGPVEEETVLPTSFAQQRLWFLKQLEPESAAYNMPWITTLGGNLDITLLRQALQTLVDRHESLRTIFRLEKESPVQVILPQQAVTLTVIDLTDIPPAKQVVTLEDILNKGIYEPFNLEQGPLFWAKVIALKDDEHIFMLNMHHIISDYWSYQIIFEELSQLYQALSNQTPAPLPPLSVQYADFADWQRENLQGERLTDQLTYWKTQLADAPAILDLPTDYPRPAKPTYQGRDYLFELPLDLTDDLKQLSRENGVTLFITLLTVFKVLLYRYTSQPDILIGTPVANRHRTEIERVVGLFINTLVLRTTMANNPTFRDLLEQVRQTTLQAQNHQDVPFEKLVEELQPDRHLNVTPLFQVMFQLFNDSLGDNLKLGDVTVIPYPFEFKVSKFDFKLNLTETPTGLAGIIEYSSDLFNESTMIRLSAYYHHLLKGIVTNPDQILSDLPMLGTAEKRTLLDTWLNNQVEHGPPLCIHHMVEIQAAEKPEMVALVFEDVQLTYGDLNEQANQLAHYLQSQGVGPETGVALYLDRSWRVVVAMLATLKAGGYYIPLDLRLPPERLAFILEDTASQVILTENQLAMQLPNNSITTLNLDSAADLLSKFNSANPHSAVTAANIMYILFTSGSTGVPKGVMVEHQQLFNYLQGVTQRLKLPLPASYATVSAFSADLGNTVIFPPLCLGGTLHIISEERLANPNQLGDYFASHQIDCLKIVPSHLTALLNSTHPAQILPRQRLILGGEASDRRLIEQIHALAPDCLIFNHYGPTETTVGVTTCPVKVEELTDRLRHVPLGRPIPNIQPYVLDTHLNPVPIGVPGELYLAGLGLSRGYLNRPQQTALTFIPNPFYRSNSAKTHGGERLYKTGDRVRYLPDGRLEFLGRIDHQVKIRGFRVELGEIEAALTSHPNIKETVVTVQEINAQDKRLIGYIVPKNGMEPPVQALRDFLKEKLANQMIPGVFVFLAALPLNANGKLNRKALPLPDISDSSLTTDFVPPETDEEITLAEIWSTVLGIEKIGLHDDFFLLGGHSLLIIRIITRIHSAFEVNLTVADFFTAPTIAKLAQLIEAKIIENLLDELEDLSDEDIADLLE